MLNELFFKREDITAIRFSFSEISLLQREELKKELNEFLGTDNAKFVLNLANIGFLSSLVIATIVFFTKEARKKSGDVKLCELSKDSLQVFKITQLDKVFEVYDTEQAAIESFSSK